MLKRSKKRSAAAKPKKPSRKKPVKTSRNQSLEKNRKAHWKAFRDLQKEASKAWLKLQKDVRRKAAPSLLVQDRNRLALLLGECDYMIRECMDFAMRAQRLNY